MKGLGKLLTANSRETLVELNKIRARRRNMKGNLWKGLRIGHAEGEARSRFASRVTIKGIRIVLLSLLAISSFAWAADQTLGTPVAIPGTGLQLILILDLRRSID
ncbi:hypothetical protein [Trinickia dabaoshanensis]|uniref:hypothetical protein n=1 Tax=Trinickia dabaoshanensis TaxID=564714 RepID=UPI0011AF8C70|nr:hypothetical protein [Trinickia dabaoshanensis]